MSPREKRVRWGVLGCARIAREHVIPAMQRACNSDFCAVASRQESKLEECRANFQGVQTYSSYEELLRDPDLDAVYIPLPNSMHCEWVIKAAENRKHVLCEKPLALNAGECRRMIEACITNGVSLMEAFMYRFTERTALALEVIQEGDLGMIESVHSTFQFLLSNPASIKLKPELGGGALYDVGCYAVNFIGLVADVIHSGNWVMPESVVVKSARVGGVDLEFAAEMKYATGLVGTLNCGFNGPRRVVSEIRGTDGVLEIPDTFLDNAGVMTLTVGKRQREIHVPQSDRYRLQVEDFAAGILRRRAPLVSLAETQRNLAVMDQLFAASPTSER